VLADGEEEGGAVGGVVDGILPGCEGVGGDLRQAEEFLAFDGTGVVLWQTVLISITFSPNRRSRRDYYAPCPAS